MIADENENEAQITLSRVAKNIAMNKRIYMKVIADLEKEIGELKAENKLLKIDPKSKDPTVPESKSVKDLGVKVK